MTVRKVKGGYAIFSKTGKKLSKIYKTKESPEMKKRMKGIEMFKHMEK